MNLVNIPEIFQGTVVQRPINDNLIIKLQTKRIKLICFWLSYLSSDLTLVYLNSALNKPAQFPVVQVFLFAFFPIIVEADKF